MGATEDPDPDRVDREGVQDRRRRAREEQLDVIARPEPGTPRFEVRNPGHGTHYWVFLPSLPGTDEALCNCADFGRRGIGTCKHIEAVRLWLRETDPGRMKLPIDPDGRALWSRLDEALADRARARPLDPVRLRRPGELLLDEPGARTGARGPSGPRSVRPADRRRSPSSTSPERP